MLRRSARPSAPSVMPMSDHDMLINARLRALGGDPADLMRLERERRAGALRARLGLALLAAVVLLALVLEGMR